MPTQSATKQSWTVTCADMKPGCGFQVRSENKKEIVEIVRAHANKIHDMTPPSENDIMDMAKPNTA